MPPQLTVPPELQDSEPEPFERSVCLALAEAATAARRIIDQLSVTRSLETVVSGVAHGVSSNLCEALAGLLGDAGTSRSLEMSFRWAAARPVRVALAGSAYQHAARAHADGLWISCEGELVRQGSTTILLEPRNLVAFAPDAMRDFTSWSR